MDRRAPGPGRIIGDGWSRRAHSLSHFVPRTVQFHLHFPKPGAAAAVGGFARRPAAGPDTGFQGEAVIRKLILPGLIVVAGVAAIALIAVTRPHPEADQAALEEVEQIDVVVRPARRDVVSLSANGQGTVSPKREIDLVAQVSGSVVWVAPGIDDGAFFRAGAPLIRVDQRDYTAALSSAKARLAAASRTLAEEQGRARQAKREWRDLGNDTANALFLREPQLAAASAELEAAQAALQLARVNLERTSIAAPFDGRISKLHVDLGQFVVAGVPVASIYDTSAAEVRIPLTDKQLAILQLPLGRASGPGPEVHITADVAGRSYHWQGSITRTDASVDTQSRMYFAIAEVKDPFGSESQAAEVPLMPGLFVSASIAGRELNDVIELPRDALVRRSMIYVLDDDKRVRATDVEVLKKSDSSVWLRADIDDGTPIVLTKHALLSVGTQVEPVPEQAASPAGTPPAGSSAQ